MMTWSRRSLDMPSTLTRLDQVRSGEHRFWAACSHCRRGQWVEPDTLRGRASGSKTVGELWIEGRFKCGGCGAPASAVLLYGVVGVNRIEERWALDEPGVAEALKRHWRGS